MIEEKYYGGIVGMAQKKLKVGIIGCGGIANGKHMPGLAKLDTVEMVAFCDTIEERAVRAAKQYGTAEAKTYTDYRESSRRLSMRTCARPTVHTRKSQLLPWRRYRCESPWPRLPGKPAMVEEAQRTGKKLTIGYQNRSS